VNFLEDRIIEALLWSRMYCSSGAGKAGESGNAIDLAARMAKSVTGSRNLAADPQELAGRP
jgi:hypothetical protein